MGCERMVVNFGFLLVFAVFSFFRCGFFGTAAYFVATKLEQNPLQLFCCSQELFFQAQLRFSGEENGAATAWDAAVAAGEDGKVLLDGKVVSGKILEGEEEEAYWNEFNK